MTRLEDSRVLVGVGDFKVARTPEAELQTLAIGSCIGLSAWDPDQRIGALLHFMLPKPSGQTVPPERLALYATTGIQMLFRQMAELGAKKKRLVLCAAGAAEVLSDTGAFAIGRRNRTMMRKLLWKHDIALAGEDTGGNHARSMSLALSTGTVCVGCGVGETVLWST